MEFHLEFKLYQTRQDSGQWEQLASANPSLKYAEDIELFTKYKDHRRFTYFIMGLRENFEHIRAALLNCSPLPSLNATVKELISEKNQRPYHHLPSSDIILAIPRPSASTSNRPHRHCKFCKKPVHDIFECYRKQRFDKKKRNQSRGLFPLSQAAVVSSSNLSAPIHDPPVTVFQLETLFHWYMSQPSTAISVAPGNKSWLLDSVCCNHMTPYASHFSHKTHLSLSPVI